MSTWKKNPPIANDIPQDACPTFFFELILTEQFVDALVDPLHKKSKWTTWTELNRGEMRQFVKLTFSTELVSVPGYKKYWSWDFLDKNEHISFLIFLKQRTI